MAWELEVINWTQRRRLSTFSSLCNFLMQLRIPSILIFKVFIWFTWNGVDWISAQLWAAQAPTSVPCRWSVQPSDQYILLAWTQVPHRELPSCDKGDFRGHGQKSRRHHGRLKRILREAAGRDRPHDCRSIGSTTVSTHTHSSPLFPPKTSQASKRPPPLSCRSRS